MEILTLENIEALPRDYLTAKEVAAVMGISAALFYRKCGEMPFPVIKVGRSYRIPKRPFMTYMQTGQSAKK